MTRYEERRGRGVRRRRPCRGCWFALTARHTRDRHSAPLYVRVGASAPPGGALKVCEEEGEETFADLERASGSYWLPSECRVWGTCGVSRGVCSRSPGRLQRRGTAAKSERVVWAWTWSACGERTAAPSGPAAGGLTRCGATGHHDRGQQEAHQGYCEAKCAFNPDHTHQHLLEQLVSNCDTGCFGRRLCFHVRHYTVW